MNQTNIAIAGMFFITLISRVGFLFFKKTLKLNNTWQLILKLAPAVALATTIMLDTFFMKNDYLGFVNNARLIAVVIAMISFILSRKIWVSLIMGILVWCIFIICKM